MERRPTATSAAEEVGLSLCCIALFHRILVSVLLLLLLVVVVVVVRVAKVVVGQGDGRGPGRLLSVPVVSFALLQEALYQPTAGSLVVRTIGSSTTGGGIARSATTATTTSYFAAALAAALPPSRDGIVVRGRHEVGAVHGRVDVVISVVVLDRTVVGVVAAGGGTGSAGMGGMGGGSGRGHCAEDDRQQGDQIDTTAPQLEARSRSRESKPGVESRIGHGIYLAASWLLLRRPKEVRFPVRMLLLR